MSDPSPGSSIPPDYGQYGGYQYPAGPNGQNFPPPGNGPTGPKQPLSTRLASTLEGWQKVVIAVTALIVAVGGLYVAATNAAHPGSPNTNSALQPSLTTGTSGAPVVPWPAPILSPDPTTNSQPTESLPPISTPPPAQSSPPTESQSPIDTPPSAQSSPPIAKPTFRGTQTVTISPGGYLTYHTPQGPEPALSYAAGLLMVGSSNVRIAILNSPATSSTAYAACENDDGSQSMVELDTLPSDASICVFTPDKQVLWVQPKPGSFDDQYSGNGLTAIVSTWQGSGP